MSKYKILIVDDSEVNRFVLDTMLNEYDLTEADSGAAMYEKLKEQEFDLILLDIMMPGKSGLELLLEMKLNELYKNIPIILVSAKSTGLDISKGLELGANDYVVKPIDENILKARIDSVMRQVKASEKLVQLSTIDPLTELYNRRYFFDRAVSEWDLANRKARNLAIGMIDIDFFKNINDTYGHDQGDIVLKDMAILIKENLRNSDIVARYGGEEFVILMPDYDKNDAVNAFVRIRKAVYSHDFVLNNSEIKITFTAGIADKKDLAADYGLPDLVKLADERLYHGKRSGRNMISLVSS